MDGIVHATFVDLKDESLLSPDTSEFVTLERQILEQQPNFIIGSETGSATSEAPQSPHRAAPESASVLQLKVSHSISVYLPLC